MILRALFIIFSLFISLSLLLSSPFYAQEIASASTSTYELPYPGLLPDHPLYWVKVARDSLFGFFISNPVKQSEFALLQADKRIEASYLLATKHKKADLADATYSKGENYFESALVKAQNAKREGKDIHEVSKKLIEANRKHIEVGEDIMNELDKNKKKEFETELQRAKSLGKKASAIKP